MTNEDLLYGTRNSTQYSVTAGMGKGPNTQDRVHVRICAADSFLCTPETNMTL